MDCCAWPSRHWPALTVENSASPPRGAHLLVSPEHPLVCCLSFALSSLPLSHTVTPPDAVTPLTDHWPHRPPALFLSFSSLFFLLQFSGSPFSLSLFFDSLLLYNCTASQQFVFVLFFYLFDCFTAICFFFFFILLLVSVISTHTQYTMSMSLSIT